MVDSLSEKIFSLINRKEELIHFSEKELLLDQGQELNHIIYLAQGSVEVNQYSHEGRRYIPTYLHAPQFLGLIEYLTNLDLIYSQIRSLTEGSYLFLSTREMDTLLQDPFLSQYFIKYLAYLNQSNFSKRSKERILNKKMRLLDFLYEIAAYSSPPVEISLNKEDISDILQIPYRSLYRYLRELEKEDFFIRRGQSIWIYENHKKRIRETLSYQL